MSRAQATLKQLRARTGFLEPGIENPPTVIIRAPSQTEFWARVQGSLYELARVVSASQAMNPVVLEKK